MVKENYACANILTINFRAKHGGCAGGETETRQLQAERHRHPLQALRREMLHVRRHHLRAAHRSARQVPEHRPGGAHFCRCPRRPPLRPTDGGGGSNERQERDVALLELPLADRPRHRPLHAPRTPENQEESGGQREERIGRGSHRKSLTLDSV